MVHKPCAAKGGTLGANGLRTTEDAASMGSIASSSSAGAAIVGDSKAEPMEVSSVTVNSCSTKCKTEFDPEEDEEEEEINGDDEEPKIDMLKPPEWDVDSFEGREYYSTPEAELSPPSDEDLPLSDPKAREVYCIYKRQLIDSHGFYTDPELNPKCYYKGIRPVNLEWEVLTGKTYRQYWEEMACMCLQKLNQVKDLNVEFVKLVRGYHVGPPRSKSYITFIAREKPDGPLVEYKAKSLATFDGKRHPILCRPAPTPKP